MNKLNFCKIIFSVIVATLLLLSVSSKTEIFALSNEISIIDDNLVFSQQNYALIETPPSFSSINIKEGFFDEKIAGNNFIADNSLQKQKQESQNQNQERKEIIIYKVVAGDTLSSIALKYNLKISTILWSNNLLEKSIIKPGDEIKILPVDGLLHQVRRGESVGQIANIYQSSADEIIRWNNLDSKALINEGDELIIPNGIKPAPVIRKTTPSSAQNNSVRQTPSAPITSNKNYNVSNPSLGSRKFPYGQCTYYVAQRRYVPWMGNAGTWLENARAYGFSVCYNPGCQPTPGAIVVTRESAWGHVAYVENVTESSIVVSEMNSPYWGKVTSRTISKNSPVIKGYIY